jgi:hypothetical protein
VCYESNLDYEATHDVLVRNSVLIVDITKKGMISARFKGSKTWFLISPQGTIEVYWQSEDQKRVLWDVFKNLLVPHANEELQIKPTKQRPTILYPPPPDLQLYWCQEKTEYSQTMPEPELVIQAKGIDDDEEFSRIVREIIKEFRRR